MSTLGDFEPLGVVQTSEGATLEYWCPVVLREFVGNGGHVHIEHASRVQEVYGLTGTEILVVMGPPPAPESPTTHNPLGLPPSCFFG